jgi:hypothetical protein
MAHLEVSNKKSVIHDLDLELIFECDDSIGFVGVCSKSGQLLDAQYRPGVNPLLTDSGLQFSVMKTAIRSVTRDEYNEGMGKPIYSVTSYENIKRASIPFGNDLLLLVSFEKNQDESHIMQKILEIINQNEIKSITLGSKLMTKSFKFIVLF